MSVRQVLVDFSLGRLIARLEVVLDVDEEALELGAYRSRGLQGTDHMACACSNHAGNVLLFH